METILNVFLGIFLILGIILIFKTYKPIIMRKKLEKEISIIQHDSTAILSSITNERDVRKISQSFVLLLQSSYVLIHTMINEGNKYNDEVQSKSFCASLTPEVLGNLNSLEGKYE